jgi:hypothetical protein
LTIKLLHREAIANYMKTAILDIKSYL